MEVRKTVQFSSISIKLCLLDQKNTGTWVLNTTIVFTSEQATKKQIFDQNKNHTRTMRNILLSLVHTAADTNVVCGFGELDKKRVLNITPEEITTLVNEAEDQSSRFFCNNLYTIIQMKMILQYCFF